MESAWTKSLGSVDLEGALVPGGGLAYRGGGEDLSLPQVLRACAFCSCHLRARLAALAASRFLVASRLMPKKCFKKNPLNSTTVIFTNQMATPTKIVGIAIQSHLEGDVSLSSKNPGL